MSYNHSPGAKQPSQDNEPFHTTPLAYDNNPSRQSNTFYEQSNEQNKSDFTLNEEYDAAREKAGLAGVKQTRGSIAAQMAASGEIPRKAGLKMFRSDEHHGTFTRGGRYRMCGRCCCCTVIVALLVIIGVVAGFLLWVRPPNVIFYGVENPSGGPEVSLIDGSGFSINVNLKIGVTNPNFFGANFKKISATAFYPIARTEMGGGSLENVDFKANTNNTLHFPLTVNYTQTIDPNGAILSDIATKCGFIGNTQAGNLNVDYTLTLKFKLVAITISPSISSSVSFPCPLSESDIQGIIGSSGLGGILGGNGKRSEIAEFLQLTKRNSTTVDTT